jgi:NAD(P)H-flavin reductase
MPAPPADARSMMCEVISVEPSGSDGVLLRVRPDAPLTVGGAPLTPNRFFMLRREDGLSPAIPRPFSIYREVDGDLVFMIKVIGPGTRAFELSRPGEQLRLIGPLGLGWPDFRPGSKPWVFLAGGIGSAPFFMAVESLMRAAEAAGGGLSTDEGGLSTGATRATGTSAFGAGVFEPTVAQPVPAAADSTATDSTATDSTATERAFAPQDFDQPPPFLLYGAANAGLLYDVEAFAELDCALHVATDDGSMGFQGNVLQLLDRLQADGLIPVDVRLAACGPLPMLRAVARFAEAKDYECWVSLEEMMGCGVGICNGCVVETKPDGAHGKWPNLKACVEGPAFCTADVVLSG